ncbi:MAG: hypothetical protein JSV49_03710 [Thermoplasmata archaeon]|nr:MAG: hypothetical protein JSV49_03710 [Thermoplasmata archaeon]
MSIKTLFMAFILFILIAGVLDANLSGEGTVEAESFSTAQGTNTAAGTAQEGVTNGLPEQPFDKYFKEYFTLTQMNEQLQRLAKTYPDIMRIEDLTRGTAHGATWQGRSMWGVKISDNVNVEEPDEPKVVILGNIHAREWMAFEVPMYYIFHLCENYGLPPTDNDGDGAVNEDMFNGKDDDSDGLVDEDWSEARVTYLVDHREIWVVPTLNPDGTAIDFKMQAEGSGSWRKNARDNNGNGVFDPDFDGVDLNRNFPYYWHANQQGIISENGIEQRLDSSIPTSGVYRGPQDNHDNDGDSIITLPDWWDPVYREDRNGIDEDPWDGEDNDGDGKIDEDKDGGFSEPETQGIGLLMDKLDTDGNHHNMRSDVGLALSYHAVGGWVIWPWGYTYNEAPHEDLLVYIGHELMDQTGYASWWDDNMYLTSGDSDDFMYGCHGVLSYTIELNDEDNAGFHPPTELIINTSRKLLTCNLFITEMTGVAKIAKENDYLDLDIGLPILKHNQRHTKYSSAKAYEVQVEVGNHHHVDPNSMMIHYRVGTDGPYRAVKMMDTGSIVEGNTTGSEKAVYSGKIPALPEHDGKTVYYYITCDDVRGLLVSEPLYGENEPYSYELDSRIDFTLFDAAVAILMTVIFIAIVWGGFFKGVHIAVKADRRKAVIRE